MRYGGRSAAAPCGLTNRAGFFPRWRLANRARCRCVARDGLDSPVTLVVPSSK